MIVRDGHSRIRQAIARWNSPGLVDVASGLISILKLFGTRLVLEKKGKKKKMTIGNNKPRRERCHEFYADHRNTAMRAQITSLMMVSGCTCNCAYGVVVKGALWRLWMLKSSWTWMARVPVP